MTNISDNLTFKRIEYHSYGGPETMAVANFVLTVPQKNQVTVRVKATAINPIDWKIRSGYLKMITGKKFPRAMGIDFAGVVQSVGSEVSRLKPGDEVFGMARFKEGGSFAEALMTDENLVVAKPGNMSFEQAASLPTAAVTAWNALVDAAQIKSGQQIFINGCTGGVGEAAAQIAQMMGAKVAGSCSEASMPKARQQGITPIVDYKKLNPANYQETFDVVFDTSGTLSPRLGLQMVKRSGKFITIHPSLAGFLRSMFARRFKVVFCKPSLSILEKIAVAATSGKLCPTIGKTVPFANAIELITDLEQGKRINGKGVLVFP
jgi:NADPH:quinone reductase-like Zn-dependent oxidoreductase